jgi:hypothetical protein
MDALREEFLDTARWRREKAAEYPDDERNLAAAQTLERLAETVGQIDSELLAVFSEEFHDDIFDTYGLFCEMLRETGFETDYETAAEFVRSFISNSLELAGEPKRGL